MRVNLVRRMHIVQRGGGLAAVVSCCFGLLSLLSLLVLPAMYTLASKTVRKQASKQASKQTQQPIKSCATTTARADYAAKNPRMSLDIFAAVRSARCERSAARAQRKMVSSRQCPKGKG